MSAMSPPDTATNPPPDTAVYWINYTAEYKGATHLRSYSMHLMWFQVSHIRTTYTAHTQHIRTTYAAHTRHIRTSYAPHTVQDLLMK